MSRWRESSCFNVNHCVPVHSGPFPIRSSLPHTAAPADVLWQRTSLARKYPKLSILRPHSGNVQSSSNFTEPSERSALPHNEDVSRPQDRRLAIAWVTRRLASRPSSTHPDALVLPALSANTAAHVGGIRTVLEVVPARCRQSGFQLFRPFLVGLGEPHTWLEVRPRSRSTPGRTGLHRWRSEVAAIALQEALLRFGPPARLAAPL